MPLYLLENSAQCTPFQTLLIKFVLASVGACACGSMGACALIIVGSCSVPQQGESVV